MSENEKPHNRIAELRKEKGLTLQQVADAIGVGNNTISRYETGKREPKLETWLKLADFFGVSVTYLQGINNYNAKNIYENYDDFLNANSGNDDNAVTSMLSENALTNFKKLYSAMSEMDDLSIPIDKFDFETIANSLDNPSDLNQITEYVAYTYEALVKSIVKKDKKSMEIANKIKSIIDSTSEEE